MQAAVDQRYIDGYVAGYNAARAEATEPPPLTISIEGIAEKLGVKMWKARTILLAIRHSYGGGKLDSSQHVLMSEFLDWASNPERKYKKNIYKKEEE